MSRHQLRALNPDRYEVVVGWDRPLSTHFLIVRDLTIDDQVGDPVVVWLGAARRAFLPEVKRRASHYAVWPDGLTAALEDDRFERADPNRKLDWRTDPPTETP